MSAGKKFEYMWADAATKKTVKLSAPKYVEALMQWIQEQLDDETVFPSQIGNCGLIWGIPFPKNFSGVVKNIFKRIFRVYAHMYHHHFKDIQDLREEPHLNTSFKHFTFFVLEFNLIDRKELAPLEDLIARHTAGMQQHWIRLEILLLICKSFPC